MTLTKTVRILILGIFLAILLTLIAIPILALAGIDDNDTWSSPHPTHSADSTNTKPNTTDNTNHHTDGSSFDKWVSAFKYEPWMFPVTCALCVFDVLSFIAMTWIWVEGMDGMATRLGTWCFCSGLRRDGSRQRMSGRWQNEQWVRLDEEEERRRTMRRSEIVAWERHVVVHAEMRRFGLA
ncbi:hypothetical protein P280DRAFT_518689 [Massarina eburnea CBS 473.64]|uniref:Uncharacterized protein n=1 Tax=Massarina eburnea CBS 473.64 TaxID=1395130 RepID=A0A6A6S213_9PLEO|nr:hypothetical protein P280DRAFT_518689 [Massarina eburnea CBS 473.64]